MTTAVSGQIFCLVGFIAHLAGVGGPSYFLPFTCWVRTQKTLQSSCQSYQRAVHWNAPFQTWKKVCSGVRIKDVSSCPSTPTKQMDDLGCLKFPNLASKSVA